MSEAEFRLYAVCSRFPHNLAGEVSLQPVQPGVYDCRRGTDRIRVIVVSQLPETEANVPLVLFSASLEKARYGAKNYRPRSDQTSTVVYQLLEGLHEEGLGMPYTIEEFNREFYKRHKKKFLAETTPEERVQGLSPEERVQGLSPEQRVQGLSPEQLAQVLSVDELERLLQLRRKTEASSEKKAKPPARRGRKS